jgi:hypothetical protein
MHDVVGHRVASLVDRHARLRLLRLGLLPLPPLLATAAAAAAALGVLRLGTALDLREGHALIALGPWPAESRVNNESSPHDEQRSTKVVILGF